MSSGRTKGTPYDLADEEIYHQLFPKGHPYYAAVIGSHADVEAARLNDVRDFFQHYYTPNNASIAIAGDFDPAQLKTLLEKYFGPIPAGPAVDKVTVTTPADHLRASRHYHRHGPAAASFAGVADPAKPSTRRRRCRPLRAHPGWTANPAASIASWSTSNRSPSRSTAIMNR